MRVKIIRQGTLPDLEKEINRILKGAGPLRAHDVKYYYVQESHIAMILFDKQNEM